MVEDLRRRLCNDGHEDDVRELIIAPRRQHSQMPEEANDGIERLWPAPYLEIFARNRRPG